MPREIKHTETPTDDTNRQENNGKKEKFNRPEWKSVRPERPKLGQYGSTEKTDKPEVKENASVQYGKAGSSMDISELKGKKIAELYVIA